MSQLDVADGLPTVGGQVTFVCPLLAVQGSSRTSGLGGLGKPTDRPQWIKSMAASLTTSACEYLNNLPTSFVLPPEAVDRLRAAAGTIILSSPDFQRPLKDIGTKVVEDRQATGGPAAVP
jgi:hypothetical protein